MYNKRKLLGFNSNMVRLKAVFRQILPADGILFQFQYGSIKRRSS